MADEIRIDDLTEKTTVVWLDDEIVVEEYDGVSAFETKKQKGSTYWQHRICCLTIENVDLTTVAETEIIDITSGLKIVGIIQTDVRLKTKTGTLGTEAQISIGLSGTANEISSTTTISGATAIDGIVQLNNASRSVVDISAKQLVAKVVTAATGMSSYTADITIYFRIVI